MMVPSLIVATENLLKQTGGGMQLCNREYMACLELAGFRLHQLPYEVNRTVLTKVTNKILPKPSRPVAPKNLLVRVEDAIKENKVDVVFYGRHAFPEISSHIKKTFPKVKQVLLSHGTNSVDILIDQWSRRVRGEENHCRFISEHMIGQELMGEASQRLAIDAVLTLSEFEVELERWLGSSRSLWVPRTVMEPELKFAPVEGRVGCVSTLDHPPNWLGLRELFAVLEKKALNKDFRFRLIGQPEERGAILQRRFHFVDYLGPLSNTELRAEAESWCCFVHPIFVYAQGCSTKVAVALGWGLPIATTAFGVRGYIWDESCLPLADSPAELAQFVLARSTKTEFEQYRYETSMIRRGTPDMKTLAEKVLNFLSDC